MKLRTVHREPSLIKIPRDFHFFTTLCKTVFWLWLNKRYLFRLKYSVKVTNWQQIWHKVLKLKQYERTTHRHLPYSHRSLSLPPSISIDDIEDHSCWHYSVFFTRKITFKSVYYEIVFCHSSRNQTRTDMLIYHKPAITFPFVKSVILQIKFSPKLRPVHHSCLS